MEASANIQDLLEALSKAQAEIELAKRESDNPFKDYKYADLASVWDVIREPLTKNGLCIIQIPESANADGLIHVTTIIGHKSGQFIKGSIPMRPTKDDPQGIGSAITYGRRYALQAFVGVASVEDDDGEAASSPASPAKDPAGKKGPDPEGGKAAIARRQKEKEEAKRQEPQTPAKTENQPEDIFSKGNCTPEQVKEIFDWWKKNKGNTDNLAQYLGSITEISGIKLCSPPYKGGNLALRYYHYWAGSKTKVLGDARGYLKAQGAALVKEVFPDKQPELPMSGEAPKGDGDQIDFSKEKGE